MSYYTGEPPACPTCGVQLDKESATVCRDHRDVRECIAALRDVVRGVLDRLEEAGL